ncbi:fructosamine kinase family protein [uncultured Apibacter sp.]|uniref:fructosamine kinase family protein n=3 Tax=Apibacter TaxID=1778601 RepID=UPI0025FB4E94|nr:fructosamine kinase family protein [uncultured Apibacter sp.]
MDLQHMIKHLPVKIKKYRPISGGDTNKSFLLESDEGNFFMKTNNVKEFPGMFKDEVKGLKTIAETHKLKTPKIIKVEESANEQYLILELIKKGEPTKQIWENFGESLASMHKIRQPYFGFDSDNYIGRLPQKNTQASTWGKFYAQYHLEPLIKKLVDMNALHSEEVQAAENFYKKIDDIFPHEIPSLVHGDLWGGNFLISDRGEPVVIDPAVYYGHREMDLGMTRLFGGFSTYFYEAYDKAYPLTKGWEERISYTQLYPLLVHSILFGSYYLEEVKNILSEFK